MKVLIKFNAYRVMTLASKYAAPYEIAGLLYGTINGKIIVEEADVFKIQSVTVASVDVTPQEFAEHVAALDQDHVKKVIGFWHSHGTMSAFHSGIDISTSKLLVRQINPLITLTTNANGEMKAIIYVSIPKLNEIIKIEAEAEIDVGDDERLKERIEKMKKKITKEEKKAKKMMPWSYDAKYFGYGYSWADGD